VNHPLLLWSIRLALIGYFGSLALRLEPAWPRGWRRARAAWTAGCLLYVLHVLAAFHFAHAWRHAASYEHTARQTQAFTGVAWGGGLWLNHLFTVVWATDAVWWWLAPQAYLDRPRWLTLSIHAWLAFIAFNATVVFGQGPLRWLSAAAWMSLAILAFLSLRRRNAAVLLEKLG
jgi:hypothetical protein